ncbi:MAG TPA: hypothetical protein VFW34_06015 [Candidatus Rubrimentiphilum sp.]|nr:hypothetical protein [Candidatus Rubrimentiphilum sp.]
MSERSAVLRAKRARLAVVLITTGYAVWLLLPIIERLSVDVKTYQNEHQANARAVTNDCTVVPTAGNPFLIPGHVGPDGQVHTEQDCAYAKAAMAREGADFPTVFFDAGQSLALILIIGAALWFVLPAIERRL